MRATIQEFLPCFRCQRLDQRKLVCKSYGNTIPPKEVSETGKCPEQEPGSNIKFITFEEEARLLL